MLEALLDYLQGIWVNWPPAAARLLLMAFMIYAFWQVQNRLTKFDDGEELYVKNNVAYLLHRLALVVAFVIATLPSLARFNDEDKWSGLIGQFLEHFYVFVALLLVRIVVDKVVLFRIDNLKELLDGNVPLGIVEAGFYVGFGFILNGSLDGEASSVALAFASTVVFGLLGLIFMVGVFAFHELVTPWHLHSNIREAKYTAAFEVAGILAASGIVIREGVAGPFTNWEDGFVAFFATALVAVATLYLFRWVIDRAILINCSVSTIQAHNQVVASALMSGMFVAIAFPIAIIVRTQL